jgi:DNA-binding NtrC family response regulator
VLSQLRQLSPTTDAILMTGHASLETAVEAVRHGAFEYITKPCKLAELEVVLRRIAEKRELANQNAALRQRVKAAEGPSVLIGNSPAMQRVHRLIATIAPTDATVLILGETGTGKELVARAIYEQSKRVSSVFVPVNCGALAENLVESELFGHRKGAFTGADRDHKGLFEVANGGTLFLDEMGELTKNIQVKLLRFLESGEIRRTGESEPFRADVRVLCATNREVREMIAKEEFREDLYFRINTFEIVIPALRERRSDIPDLANHLLARAARKPREQVADLLRPDTIDALLEHDWPGNVRELANVMEYAFIVAAGGRIAPEHLPNHLHQAARRVSVPFPSPSTSAHAPPPAAVPSSAAGGARTLREIEMEHVLVVLAKHNNNKPAAAAELGISLKTLYNKLNQLQEERKNAG